MSWQPISTKQFNNPSPSKCTALALEIPEGRNASGGCGCLRRLRNSQPPPEIFQNRLAFNVTNQIAFEIVPIYDKF